MEEEGYRGLGASIEHRAPRAGGSMGGVEHGGGEEEGYKWDYKLLVTRRREKGREREGYSWDYELLVIL